MNFIVTGAGGQLGLVVCDLLRSMNFEVKAFDKDTLDITNPDLISNLIDESADCLINCAAYTNVDASEMESELSEAINTDGPKLLAIRCAQAKVKLVHISTDYVFDGNKESYHEDDIPDPINAYGKFKLAGEEWIREIHSDHLIIRTSWLYANKGHNFVNSILRQVDEGKTLSVVTDQKGSPTYAPHLAHTMLQIIKKDLKGTFHLANQGMCSWYEFANKILFYANIDLPIVGISSNQLCRRARRPKYSHLTSNRLNDIPSLPNWEKGLQEFFQNR